MGQTEVDQLYVWDGDILVQQHDVLRLEGWKREKRRGKNVHCGIAHNGRHAGGNADGGGLSSLSAVLRGKGEPNSTKTSREILAQIPIRETLNL